MKSYTKIIIIFIITTMLLSFSVANTDSSEQAPLPHTPVPSPSSTLITNEETNLILSPPDTFTAIIVEEFFDNKSITLVDGDTVHLAFNHKYVLKGGDISEFDNIHHYYTISYDLLYDKEAYLKSDPSFITGTFTKETQIPEFSYWGEETWSITSNYVYDNTPELVPLIFAILSEEENDPDDVVTRLTDEFTINLKLPPEFFIYVTPGPTATSSATPTPVISLASTSTKTVEAISDNLVKIEPTQSIPITPTPPKPATPLQVAVGTIASAMFVAFSGLTINNAAFLGASKFGSSMMNTPSFNQTMQEALIASQHLASTQKTNMLAKTNNFFHMLWAGLRDMLTDEGRSYTSEKITKRIDNTNKK